MKLTAVCLDACYYSACMDMLYIYQVAVETVSMDEIQNINPWGSLVNGSRFDVVSYQFSIAYYYVRV